jgi:hypothetical protein
MMRTHVEVKGCDAMIQQKLWAVHHPMRSKQSKHCTA